MNDAKSPELPSNSTAFKIGTGLNIALFIILLFVNLILSVSIWVKSSTIETLDNAIGSRSKQAPKEIRRYAPEQVDLQTVTPKSEPAEQQGKVANADAVRQIKQAPKEIPRYAPEEANLQRGQAENADIERDSKQALNNIPRKPTAPSLFDRMAKDMNLTKPSTAKKEVVSTPVQVDATNNTAQIKIGFDRQGNPIAEKQKALQVMQLERYVRSGGDDKYMRYYANGDEKGHLVVFSDPNCSICRKFHKDIDQLNDRGVTVTYIMTPISKSSKHLFSSAWCSEDKQVAFDSLYARKAIPSADCDTENGNSFPYAQHINLGKYFTLRGTPTMFTSSGVILEGYRTPEQLLDILG